MKMKLVKSVMNAAGIKTNYKLAKLLDVSVQLVDSWTGKAKGRDSVGGMQLRYLCKLRLISDLSWEKFGSMLDREFLKDD